MYSSIVTRLVAAAALAFAAPLGAQITQIDPNDAGEYEPAAAQASPVQEPVVEDPAPLQDPAEEYYPIEPAAQPAGEPATQAPAADAAAGISAEERASRAAGKGVAKENVLTAAEGVFGRGAEGLAGLIEDLLKKQGEPSGYITGSEAGGAVVVGLRYGKGVLHHKSEGDRKVYWTGPSVGFDFGGSANKVFVLVYNLDESDKLFTRFGAAEGNAYAVGGLTASYLRHGNMVLIPIRTGLGLRLGVNAGYMKFTKKGTWMPF